MVGETKRQILKRRSKEQYQFLKIIVFGICGLIAVVFIISTLSGGSSSYYEAQDLYNRALLLKNQGHLEEALNKLNQIPASISEYYVKGRNLSQEIESTLIEKRKALQAEEAKAFDDFKNYAYKHSNDIEAIKQKADEFRVCYPQSIYIQEFDKVINDWQKRYDEKIQSEFQNINEKIRSYISGWNYAEAIKELNEFYNKYKYSKLHYDILKKYDEIIKAGISYYKNKTSETDDLLKKKKYHEARTVYCDIRSRLGNGVVLEFKAFCDSIDIEIETLNKIIK